MSKYLVMIILIVSACSSKEIIKNNHIKPKVKKDLCSSVSNATLHVLVFKKERELYVCKNKKTWKKYPIALGKQPNGDKERKGDRKTPEGSFLVCQKKDSNLLPQLEPKAIMINYPSRVHAENGLKKGLISKREYRKIIRALDKNQIPLQHTKLGGGIYFHGSHVQNDWTLGCIDLNYDDIVELYDIVNYKTKIQIFASKQKKKLEEERQAYFNQQFIEIITRYHHSPKELISKKFIFPLQPSHKYYIMQKFKTYYKEHGGFHHGIDSSLIGRRNLAMNAPVYAIGNGLVFYADKKDKAWGYVVRVIHILEKNGQNIFLEGFYAHLNKVKVKPGDLVKTGQKLGTLGDCEGIWSDTHIHMEMRNRILPFGGGYSVKMPKGFVNPLKFFQIKRKRRRR